MLKVQLLELVHDQTPGSVVGDGMLVDNSPAHTPAATASTTSCAKPSTGERECCLLVLNLVSSTLPCIRQPGPRLFRGPLFVVTRCIWQGIQGR